MPRVDLPVLYSFRRCPYAIRARLALRYAGIQVALREVVLKDKPAEMLAVSPKGTVPVLVLNDGEVIDESLDIMLWALAQHDPDGWLAVDLTDANIIIAANDDQFKSWLDRYKYPDRYADTEGEDARAHCEVYLRVLEERLAGTPFISGSRVSFTDMATLSFVRQFAFTDMDWFAASPYTAVNRWLQMLLDSELFAAVMDKYPQWHAGDAEPLF